MVFFFTWMQVRSWWPSGLQIRRLEFDSLDLRKMLSHVSFNVEFNMSNIRCCGRVVSQQSAKLRMKVRFFLAPQKEVKLTRRWGLFAKQLVRFKRNECDSSSLISAKCHNGEIGRHAGFKHLSFEVKVRFLLVVIWACSLTEQSTSLLRRRLMVWIHPSPQKNIFKNNLVIRQPFISLSRYKKKPPYIL